MGNPLRSGRNGVRIKQNFSDLPTRSAGETAVEATKDQLEPVPLFRGQGVRRLAGSAACHGVAEAVRGFAGKHHAVLLANHGPVVAGSNLDAAVNAIEELEETAKLYLLLRGAKTRYLTAAQVGELQQ